MSSKKSFASWFISLASCCVSDGRASPGESSPALPPDPDRAPNPEGVERDIAVLQDQPVAIPRPLAEPPSSSETCEKTPGRERRRDRTKLRRPVSRDDSPRKHRYSRSSSSARRLRISGPTDFRHLRSESFQFPMPPSRPRPRSFRPIELSIHQPQNRLSPILPHLEARSDDIITPPPRAHTAHGSPWDASSGATLTNMRSYSALSFHLPRRHIRQESGVSDASTSAPRAPRSEASSSPHRAALSDAGTSPPSIPPKSRARAYTAPSTERIVERIASALIEKERLQAEIDSVIERQSIYVSSRPSTSHEMGGPSTRSSSRTRLTSAGLRPMPSVPALPAAAPSFAERVSIDGRPRTAPDRMRMTVEERAFELATAHVAHSPSSYDSPSERDDHSPDQPLAPPLPLVLRPPLRKKQSFSHISDWLLRPGGRRGWADESGSAGSSPTAVATTSPRPVRESDGFYQCVAPPEGLPRTSLETSSSVYTWETNEEDARTMPATAAASPDQTPKPLSQESTPVVGGNDGFVKEGAAPVAAAVAMTTTAAPTATAPLAAGNLDGHRPLSVGVAF